MAKVFVFSFESIGQYMSQLTVNKQNCLVLTQHIDMSKKQS